MIISSSIIQYNTSDIKRALDTKITELSSDGYYDYLPFPYYTFELPSSNGPFWKRDSIVIKWDYSEPLDNLIPSTSIYLVNPIQERVVKRNVKTSAKNINYFLPRWMMQDTNYHFRVETMFDGEKVFATSSTFTVDDRYIDITTEAPPVPIVANQGRTFEINWKGHGTGDYVKIESLAFFELNTITMDGAIGRLIGNPAGNGEYTVENTVALNGDPSNPMVLAVIEQKKYVGNNTTYTWTVDNIPYDVDNIRVKITDSYKPHVYDYTPPIQVLTPYIGIKNFMGRLVGQPIIPEVTYSGISDALLTVYGFNPTDRIVEETGSLKFNYDSTNAIQVFLTKASKANYSYVLPKLNGIYTIKNIKEDDIYTVNAKDSNNKVRKATFNVHVEMEQTINNENIIVSGYITTASVGVENVDINFTNNGGTTQTDASGYYQKELPALYTGTASPGHSLYTFIPQDITYTQLNTNMNNQNYSGTRTDAGGNPHFKIITENDLLPATVGSYYQAQLEASGGLEPYEWATPTNFPLFVNKDTGMIYGWANKIRSRTEYTFKVTDVNNHIATKKLHFQVKGN